MKATYQTRILAYAGVNRSAGDAALSACAELYGQVQRKLFAEVAAGRSAVSLKSTYLERYGIPARMFNAVRVSLQGKAVSVRKRQKLQVESLRRRISRAEKQIAQAEQRGRLEQVHHKRRRLANLECRLARLEADLAAGRLPLCFGAKRLWRKQYHLGAGGYGSHEAWLGDWRDARSMPLLMPCPCTWVQPAPSPTVRLHAAHCLLQASTETVPPACLNNPAGQGTMPSRSTAAFGEDEQRNERRQSERSGDSYPCAWLWKTPASSPLRMSRASVPATAYFGS